MPEATSTPDTVLIIERTIDAPIADVWSMWTDPEQFRAWYGPTGAAIPTARFDLRPGGERAVSMTVTTPAGPRSMWFVGEHVTVEPPTLLVYTEAIADDDGVPQGPSTTVRLQLTSLDDGRTHLRLTHVGIPADSPGATGWHLALAKLDEALAAPF